MLKNDFDASAQFDSPIGLITMFAKGEKVVFLSMGNEAIKTHGRAKVLVEAEKQLKKYFAGKSRDLNFAVELSGTEFQKSVWAEIAKIPFGEVKTYAEIAAAIGKPMASRAVGGAVGSNPVPLIVGCHRVLGASGKITGYSGGDGLPTKRWLLKLEGIESKE
ncbi:MAG: hypothetical protein RLZZ229_638 [Actinomycetota bacterium]|jgi:methylated-DNA-[protein]-cysteine S-methyltransferase